MGTEGTKTGYRESNSTADRALTILGLFTDERLVITAQEVANTLEVARSTGYRYVQSLIHSGFLEEVPGGGYRPGMRVLELARLARRAYGLSEIALPFMKRLAQEHGHTVVLTRRIGDQVVCLDRQESGNDLIRISYERGSRLPITAGASALILLAWLPIDDVRNLISADHRRRFTSETSTDVEALISRLDGIREQGYCETRGEVDRDALGIAAPIFDDSGDVVAGISTITLQHRVSDAERAQLITAVKDGAAKITRLLAITSS
jgi:DNA-binding IclR family transcriptional regulator